MKIGLENSMKWETLARTISTRLLWIFILNCPQQMCTQIEIAQLLDQSHCFSWHNNYANKQTNKLHNHHWIQLHCIKVIVKRKHVNKHGNTINSQMQIISPIIILHWIKFYENLNKLNANDPFRILKIFSVNFVYALKETKNAERSFENNRTTQRIIVHFHDSAVYTMCLMSAFKCVFHVCIRHKPMQIQF